MAMQKARWLPGDYAYLVPNLPTAPRDAYRLPKVVIVTIPRPGTAQATYIEVELPDGRRLWTNSRNLQHEPPTPQPHQTKPAATSKLHLAPDEEQPTLW